MPILAEPVFNPVTEFKQDIPANRNFQQGLISTAHKPMSQVTSVTQLRDVEPTQWAYQALRELVERYGCIVGYPDYTYRGDRALTRWEFAAGVNACLNSIERYGHLTVCRTTTDPCPLLQDGVAIAKEDIDKLKRLARDFESELAALGARINNLEQRIAFLEDHQFSTTTKLFAQTIWSINDTFGDKVGEDKDESQTQFAYRIRFNLETTFNGKDLLRTRLQMSNFAAITEVTGTNMTRLNYDDNSRNFVQTLHVLYRTPLTHNLQVTVGPVGVGYTDITDTLTPSIVADDSLGIPSRFGEYNPTYRRGGGGIAFNYNLLGEIVGASIGASDPDNRDLILTVGYLATDTGSPIEGDGLFNGGYHALAQLAYYDDWGAVSFAYSRTYNQVNKIDLTGSTGSFLASNPFGQNIPTSDDSFNLQSYVRITPNFNLHGWVSYNKAYAEGSGLSLVSDGVGGEILENIRNGDNAEFWHGAIGLTFPDVGGEGNMPGLLLGIPPTVTSSDVRSDRDTPYHIEAFYLWQLNNNIAITPGFWVILNPEGDSRNATQWVGHIRTSFNF